MKWMSRYVSVCFMCKHAHVALTHWGRVTHICVGKLTIIGSDNGLSPAWRQAIIRTNAGLLSIGPLLTYFSENLIKIQQLSLKKMHVKMLSAKWRSSCLGLNVLTQYPRVTWHVSDLVFLGSADGPESAWHQALAWWCQDTTLTMCQFTLEIEIQLLSPYLSVWWQQTIALNQCWLTFSNNHIITNTPWKIFN